MWLRGHGKHRQSCGALWNIERPADGHCNVFLPTLEPLCHALLASGSLRQGPSLPGFSWELLLRAAVIGFLVKGQQTLRREKEPAKRFSAGVEECGCQRKPRVMTQVPEALQQAPEVTRSGLGST